MKKIKYRKRAIKKVELNKFIDELKKPSMFSCISCEEADKILSIFSKDSLKISAELHKRLMENTSIKNLIRTE